MASELLPCPEVVRRHDDDAVLIGLTCVSGDDFEDQSQMRTLCCRCDSTDRLEMRRQ